jgi:hypothetical protein
MLGGLAIFMTAEKKKKRGCVKFCFMLDSEQSLTENKTSRTHFFCIISHHKYRHTSLQALRKKATTTTVNLDRRQATD